MDITAIILVVLMAVAVGAAMGVLTWGLLLEARSNREWREHGLAG
jgi:hypothetical protein